MESWIAELINFICEQVPARTMLSYPFNVRALLALVCISIMCGGVGSLVVGGRMAFFSDALAHCAFAGVAIGILVAIVLRLPREELFDWVVPVMVAFGVTIGILIVFVRERTGQSSDTVIGVFFAGAVGLGAILLKVGSAMIYFPSDEFLFGSLASVSDRDLLVLLGLVVLTLGLLAWMYNGLMLASFNESLARSRRVPIQVYQYLFIVLLAAIVNVCLSAVGALLINALLVVPAATAAILCRNLRQLFRWSVVLCLVTCVAGQVLNWEVRIPTGRNQTARMGEGGTIVVLNVLLYFLAMVLTPWLRARADRAAALAAPSGPRHLA